VTIAAWHDAPFCPQSSTHITTNGNPTLGTLAFSGVKNNTSIDFASQATTTPPRHRGCTEKSPEQGLFVQNHLSGLRWLAV
jgi:hypothetical protein